MVSRWNLRVLINTNILIHISITDYIRLNEKNNTLFVVIDSSRFIITLYCCLREQQGQFLVCHYIYYKNIQG